MIEARDQADAIARLQGDGLLPVRAEAAPAAMRPFLAQWMKPLVGRTRAPALRSAERLAVIDELAALLEGGLPLDRALALTAEACSRPGAIAIVRELREAVAGGASLSAAMARHPRSFGPLAEGIVRAGESGGALAPALRQLAAHLASAASIQSALLTALTYPALVAVIALVSVVVLLRVVVPQFTSLFDGATATLPWSTRAVFAMSEALRQYGWLAVLALGAGGYWLHRQRRDPARLRLAHAMLLRAPLIGETWRQLDIARWARILSLLLGQGVALPSALATAAPTLTNAELRQRGMQLAAKLREGQSLSHLLRAARLLPESALALLQAGEASGRLATTLAQLAERHAHAFDTRSQRALALLGPLLILGLGIVIGVIIIALLGGILSINALVA